MKKVFAYVLVLSLILLPGAFAESRSLEEIYMLQDACEILDPDDGYYTIRYDQDMDAIIFESTMDVGADFWDKARHTQSGLTMLEPLNDTYDTLYGHLCELITVDFDLYFLIYDANKTIVYLNINGDNLTPLFIGNGL